MQTKKDSKTKPGKKSTKKILTLSLAFLAVLILLLFFLTPVFVSSGKGRRLILAKINNSIDGRADFAALTMSWFKGVKITDFSFDDNAGQTSVTIKQITTTPRYCSLFTGALSFDETIIDKPKIQINLKDAPTKQIESEKSQPIVLPIKKIDLVVNDGSFKITDPQAGTARISRINSRINLRPPGKQTDFDLDMTMVSQAEESKIHTAGQLTPLKKTGWNLESTTGDLTIEVNDLDLGSLGPIFKLIGVDVQTKGRVSADIKSHLKNGLLEKVTANIKATDLDVTGGQLKTDRFQTNALFATVLLQSSQDLIQVENLNIKTDWLNINANGTVPKTYSSIEEFLKPDSPHTLKADFDCDLVTATSLMPHTLRLKEDMKLTSGRLNGNIETRTENGQKIIAAQANLVDLEGTLAEKTITLSEPVKAHLEITSDKAGIKYDRLDLSAAFANINCTGTSKLLKYNAQVDLAKLQSELAQFIQTGQYKIAGELSSGGQISGTKNKISVAGTSEVENLHITSPKGLTASEPKVDTTFAFDIEPQNNLLNIDSIKANTTFGQAAIKETVIPLNKNAAKPMKLTVSANEIDLEKLQPFMVLFASFPQQMQMAGIAESQFLISSTKDIYTFTTGSTKIKNLKLLSPQQQPFVQENVLFVFDGDYNPTEASWTVRRLLLTGPDIKIEGNFEKTIDGDKTNLQGKADLEYQLAAVGDIFSQFLPTGLEMAGKRQHTINFAAQYPTGQTDKLLPNLTAKADLGFEKAEYMGLNFGPTDVDIQVQKGLLKIAPFSTTVNNGQLNFAADTDFNKKPALLQTPGPIEIAKNIQINDQTAKQLLAYVNPIFANAVNVTGITNFTCKTLAIPLAETDKSNIRIAGTIAIDNLNLRPGGLLGELTSLAGADPSANLRIHPTNFIVQNGFVKYDDMQLDIGSIPFNFKGSIGLEDRSLDMIVTLPYTLRGKTAKVGDDSAAQRIPLPLKGTIDNPQLDTAKLLEGLLQKELETQLKRGLEELFK
ncbi:MAG: YhdP family protein [Planctomycetota bacterium]|jgi:hypothetical protein